MRTTIEPMKPECRRIRWQDDKRARGLCVTCGKKSAGGVHCVKHRDLNRARSFANMRKKLGIPLDWPNGKRFNAPKKAAKSAHKSTTCGESGGNRNDHSQTRRNRRATL